MPFLLETGVGLAGANAYVSVAEIDTYHADRGNAAWAGATGVKQIAIIRATDYIDKRFRRQFRGNRLGNTQGLQWPRYDAYDDDGDLLQGIPEVLKQAAAEYALRALLLLDLLPDPALGYTIRSTTGQATSAQGSPAGGEITSKSETVGPISESTGYASSSSAGSSRGSAQVPGYMIPAYPAADLLIEALIQSPSMDIGRG